MSTIYFCISFNLYIIINLSDEITITYLVYIIKEFKKYSILKIYRKKFSLLIKLFIFLLHENNGKKINSIANHSYREYE